MSIRIFLAQPFLCFARAVTIVGTMGAVLVMALPAFAQTGCQTGASALANAYVRANPIYALFFGDLESFVAENSAQFAEGSNTVRCARAMSQALKSGAINSYDPNALRQQQKLNADLGSIGISPGSPMPNASAMLYAMSQQMKWLSNVLPPAAAGNYGPLRTPATQEQAFAAQMFPILLQDPTVRQAFLQQEPLIRQSAESEYQQVMAIAQGLGQ